MLSVSEIILNHFWIIICILFSIKMQGWKIWPHNPVQSQIIPHNFQGQKLTKLLHQAPRGAFLAPPPPPGLGPPGRLPNASSFHANLAPIRLALWPYLQSWPGQTSFHTECSFFLTISSIFCFHLSILAQWGQNLTHTNCCRSMGRGANGKCASPALGKCAESAWKKRSKSERKDAKIMKVQLLKSM